MPEILRALAHRNYRPYFTGQLISLAGTWMQQVALLWLAYRLTGSTVMLGAVAFASQIPTLFFATLGGVLSDRFDRRVLLLWTQSLSLVHALILAALTIRLELHPPMLLTMALLLGLINSIDQPVRQSFIAELVERREDLPNAIALTSFTIHTTRFIGPSLGGVVVAFMGEGTCFLINAASYLGAIVALAFIRTQPKAPQRHSVLHALRSGVQYALGHARIRVLLGIVATMSFFGTAHITLLPYFAKTVYAGGAETFGALTAATGVGACLGTVFLASRRSASAIDHHISTAMLVSACALLLFSMTHGLAAALLELIVLGFCSINIVASSNALIQSLVEDRMRGRVMALFSMGFFGVSPLGSLVVGYASKQIGARPTLCICALAVLVVGALSARLRRHAAEPAGFLGARP
jgi:MFS family permease